MKLVSLKNKKKNFLTLVVVGIYNDVTRALKVLLVL